MEVTQEIVSLLCFGKVSMMNSCPLHQNLMPAAQTRSRYASAGASESDVELAPESLLVSQVISAGPRSPPWPRRIRPFVTIVTKIARQRQIARMLSGQGGSWMATLPTFVSTTVQFSAIAIARKPSISLVFCHNGGRRPEVHFVAGLKHIVCSL